MILTMARSVSKLMLVSFWNSGSERYLCLFDNFGKAPAGRLDSVYIAHSFLFQVHNLIFSFFQILLFTFIGHFNVRYPCGFQI